jgi:hypothetical protein
LSQIDPFIGSAIQATGVQRTQASEKDRQMRRAQDLEKNAGLTGDRFEHAVESAEALDPVHDEPKKDPRKKRPATKQQKEEAESDQEPGLDLTA